jgi:protein-tyrosine phosphatase
MLSNIYWIDTELTLKLAIMARPRAGDWLEDEVAHWKRAGIGIVVSLLERDEIDDLGLGMEATLCKENGIQYVSFPIPDRGVPNDFEAVRRFAANIVGQGKPIAIHCRAGIGRSSIIAAVIMMISGIGAGEALSAIGKARGLAVPDTDDQRDWVLSLQVP